MAPRKEKAEKVSGDEAATTILNYLRRQTEATDISANLHNKVTKAAAAKILKDLHERNEIEGRAAGKQLVYHALQSPGDSITPEQLAALDTQAADLRSSTTAFVAEAKTLRSTLANLNSTLSTADLVSSVSSLEAEKSEMMARLDGLRKGKGRMVTKEERGSIENEWKKWSAVSKRREVIVREMWKLIEGVLPEGQDKEEVREGLGLDE